MELRHLRYLVATAEAGTVSGAAVSLHMTQPSLSRQLRQLERELGVDLFTLAGRRLELSTAGKALLPLARELLERADALRVAAEFHARGRIERLTVGAPAVTLTDVVAPFIATLPAGDPIVDVLTADGRSAGETLRLGADLAIGTARASGPYRSQPLAVLPVWAQVPRSHPWAGRGRITLPELIEQPLIVLPSSFTARQSLEAAVSGEAAACTSLTVAANGTVAQALAAAGRGIAVLSDDPRFDLSSLAIDVGGRRRLSIRLVAVWDSRHAAAATLEDFASRLGLFVRQRYDVPAT